MHSTVTSHSDNQLLQKDIDSLYDRNQIWNLAFNISICKVMQIVLSSESPTQTAYILSWSPYHKNIAAI